MTFCVLGEDKGGEIATAERRLKALLVARLYGPGVGFSPAEVMVRRSVERAHGRAIYVFAEFVRYTAADGWTHAIKPGARTDWVSVPRLLTPIVPVDDKAALAAALHDDLLNDRSHGMDRQAIDYRFHEALLVVGVPRWRARAMWLAVRLQAWSTHDR